jgi:hypothetical protein
MEWIASRNSSEQLGPKAILTHFIIVGLLCTAVLVQTEWVRRSASVTFDETYYLSVALRSLRRGGFDPDLINTGVAPLPIALNYMSVLGTATREPSDDLSKGVPGDSKLIRLPRVQSTLASVIPLVLLVFGWLRARRGLLPAAFGAGLLTFSPTILAHGSLATPDSLFAFTSTLAVLCMGSFHTHANWLSLLLTAGTSSLAIGSKYTGILLIPSFFLGLAALAVHETRQARGEVGRAALRPGVRALVRGSAYLILVGLFVWALHGFGVAGDQSLLGVRDHCEPGFLAAIRTQMFHNEVGHPSFLLGSRSVKGWWYYYPVCLLLKSTIPELITFATVLGTLLVRTVALAAWLTRPGGTPEPARALTDPYRASMLLFLAILSAALVRSHINIGHRYAIALYPIAVLLATDAWAGLATARHGWMRAAGPILLASQMLASLSAAPYYLSFFHRIAGGPERGWTYLADSNVDWGQDLPALKAIIDEQGYRRVAIDYFGTASLADYGIQADSAAAWKPSESAYDALAVSVTSLNSVYPRVPQRRFGGLEIDSYRELRQFPCTHRAGQSIFVYDLKDPGLRQAFLVSAAMLKHEMVGSRPVERTAAGEPPGRCVR